MVHEQTHDPRLSELCLRRQACRELGISDTTVDRYVKDGSIRSYLLGSERLLCRADVERVAAMVTRAFPNRGKCGNRTPRYSKSSAGRTPAAGYSPNPNPEQAENAAV